MKMTKKRDFTKSYTGGGMDLPYNIGDKIYHEGQEYIVRGIHLYIGENGSQSIRYYCGNGKFVTIKL